MSRAWLWCATFVLVAALCLQIPVVSHAADEPDLIFKRSTVFKLLTPNDKLATYGIDEIPTWRERRAISRCLSAAA